MPGIAKGMRGRFGREAEDEATVNCAALSRGGLHC